MANLHTRTSLKKLWTNSSTDAVAASTYVDCQGYDGCYILVQGSSNMGSTGQIVVRQTSATSTGLAYTITRTSGMNFTTDVSEYIVLDVYRPLKRYVSIKPAFSSGILKGVALRYAGRRAGSTEQHANVLKGFVIPATS
jgi:hypothetical protein